MRVCVCVCGVSVDIVVVVVGVAIVCNKALQTICTDAQTCSRMLVSFLSPLSLSLSPLSACLAESILSLKYTKM